MQLDQSISSKGFLLTTGNFAHFWSGYALFSFSNKCTISRQAYYFLTPTIISSSNSLFQLGNPSNGYPYDGNNSI